MLQSKLFTKTRREGPKDELAKNASLLVRAGFVHKEMAGVYSFLPLGLKVLKKVESIIREEMEKLGGQEVSLASLQDKNIWEKSGRWNDEVVDNWFKSSLKNKNEIGFASTHEEPLTALLKDHINSHRDLPVYIFQIQTKFRNETRAKSGLMRGREFLMKDLYSFSKNEEEHQKFYESVKKSYLRIFKKIGLTDYFLTFASGGIFSRYSHEFQAVSEAGEDIIYIDQKQKIAVNKEVFSPDVLKNLGLSEGQMEEKKSIEIGNIFSLGTRFSDAFGLTFVDKDGQKKPVIMGSYGIGLGRIIGTVAEMLSDERGLVWPKEIAPFKIHLIRLGEDSKTKKEANAFYKKFLEEGVEVLYDDRDVSAGEKFSDSDLIGIPYRVIVSKKIIADGGRLEVRERKTGKTKKINFKQTLQLIK